MNATELRAGIRVRCAPPRRYAMHATQKKEPLHRRLLSVGWLELLEGIVARLAQQRAVACVAVQDERNKDSWDLGMWWWLCANCDCVVIDCLEAKQNAK